MQRLVRANPHQSALQTPNICSDALREESQNILSYRDMKFIGL
jgi:hypothetical protein